MVKQPAGEPPEQNRRIGDYDPADLAKAPLQPPKPATTEPPEMTNNKSVRFLLIAGIMLALVGLAVFFVNSLAGFLIMALGAAVIVAAVFVPLK